ncbi:sugar phosphate isomerase/epimerase family protein [Paenibacillus spongiae]|uniref:Sugar phosphate isomerase/epimerase n=1 Tax=Paenibacillus spongiae TaxID=2909671 RepID=A0ABY5S588_9BACL|nr:sugar phosphate isomerase/epimerase [Paenibacillus spongiae]UVI29081.1 sugar phosphate isomerase/epimerase [Paenibacillus spongiae]
MNISIASYSFHGMFNQGKIDLFGYLESLKYRYHVSGADIWNIMLSSYEEDYLRKLKEAIDDKELHVANLCVDGAHVWDEDPELRESNYQNALKNLRAAEILGAQTVRIDMGGHDLEMSDEQFDYTVKRYKEYTRRAEESGYKIGPENHWGTSRVPANIKKLVEAVDSPAFGILLHLENWDVDKENGDRLCAQYAFHTHFAAWVLPRYEEKIKNLMDAGYTGHYSVEHHSSKNEYEEVEWQLASIRRLLKQAKQGTN